MTSSSDLSPELRALAAEAAALDAETQPPPPPELDANGQPIAPAPAIDYATDARGLVDIAAETLGAFYPSTAAVLTADKRDRIAAAAAPVLEKYGFSLGAFLGRFGPEIGLAFALGQVAIPLANAIRADRAEKAKTDAPPAQAMQPVIDRTEPGALHTRV